MQLSSLYFNLDRSDYPNDYGYDLLLRSRLYGDYIERTVLKPLKFQTSDYNRIVISFHHEPRAQFIVNSSHVLSIELKFDQQKYESAKQENISLYFMEALTEALTIAESQGISLPTAELQQANETFVQHHYINKWVYKTKNWKNLKIRAVLECELTETRFELSLKIWKEENLVFDQIILTTDPDPIAYLHQFKDIDIKNNVLFVTKKIPERLFEIRLNSLLR